MMTIKRRRSWLNNVTIARYVIICGTIAIVSQVESFGVPMLNERRYAASIPTTKTALFVFHRQEPSLFQSGQTPLCTYQRRRGTLLESDPVRVAETNTILVSGRRTSSSSRLHFSNRRSSDDGIFAAKKQKKTKTFTELYYEIKDDNHDGRQPELDASLKTKNTHSVLLDEKETETYATTEEDGEKKSLTEEKLEVEEKGEIEAASAAGETVEEIVAPVVVQESTVGPVCVIPDSTDYESPNDHVRTSLYYHLDDSEDSNIKSTNIVVKDNTTNKSSSNDTNVDNDDDDFPLLSMAKDAIIKTISVSQTKERINGETASKSAPTKFVFSSDASKISSNGSGNQKDYYKQRSSDDPVVDSKTISARVTGIPQQAIPTITLVDSYSTKAEQQRDALNRAIENFILYVPIVAPVVAYNTFTNVSWLFTQIIALLAQSRWAEVDGGLYSTKILTPAINGIVVPAVSILFATLVSSTVTTLRTRQLDIRTSLNKEANNLRTLQSTIDSFPNDDVDYSGEQRQQGTSSTKQKKKNDETKFPFLTLSQYQDKCRDYLTQYVVRLIAESQDGANINTLEYTGSVDSEMNALIVQLNEIAARQQFIQQQQSLPSSNYNNGQQSSIQTMMLIPPSLLSEAYGAVAKLNEDRSIRISALQSTFPMLHYVLIMLLGNAILIVFLIESADKPNLFLNEVQLQLLWTILIGTFSALGTVLYDLSDPFRGSYQISGSRRQLYTIRDSLKASAKLKQLQRDAAKKAEHQQTPQQGGKI